MSSAAVTSLTNHLTNLSLSQKRAEDSKTNVITIDSELSHLVDLQRHFHESEWEIPRGRENITWSVSGLENGTHTLRIGKGEQAQYAVLEALIYTSTTTVPGPGIRYHHTRSFEASSPDQTSILNASAPFITTLYRRDDQQSKQPVIIGAVVGLCIALIGIGLAIAFIRYRKLILAKYGHLIGIPPIIDGETLPTDSTTHSSQMAPTTLSTPLHAAFTAEARNATPTVPGSGPTRDKALPPPPSHTSLTPTRKIARNLSRFGSKRRALGPPLTVQVINSGDNLKTNPAKSTSSSFFPNPVHELETYPIRPHRSYSVISQLDGGNEKPFRKTINPRPLRPEILPSSTTAVRPTDGEETQRPNNPWPHASLSSTSTGVDTESPLSSSPEILGKHHFPPRNSRKSLSIGISLSSIVETPIPGRSSATNSPSSTKSAKTSFKRKSEGRIRVEKDKQRRRHRRALVSPSGPRDRYSDLPSRPSSRILSYASNSARASMAMDSKASISPTRRSPRPLPPRPNIPPPSSTDNRPETPLPPYPIGSEILPLYFEKSKRVSRKSLRPPPVSATSNRHFLPSPPPSASSSGDITPVNQQTSSPRPLPVVEKRASRLSPRKLPVPSRPRALTDSATSTPQLSTVTHNKQNRSVDLPPFSQQEARITATSLASKEEAPKVNQVKPKRSSDSYASGVPSVSPLQRVPFFQSKSAPLSTIQMKDLSGSRRDSPTSVPVTPKLNSWSDSDTSRYTKSIPDVEDDTRRSDVRTSGDDRFSLSRSTLLAPSGSLTSTTPLSIVPGEKKRIGRVPPPLFKLDPLISEIAEIQEGDQSSPSFAVNRTPTTARVNIPPPPHTPPPPTPPTPRRRAKVWDDLGRRRGGRISPPIREASLLGRTTNMGGSAYSV